MEEVKIPPKEEWPSLSVSQLYEVRDQMMTKYYGLRRAGASFANQYLKFITDVDSLIERKRRDAELDQD